MTKIHCFITGFGSVCGYELYTACALTSAGKWIAGAVSLYSDIALKRCGEMALKRAPEMISDKDIVIEQHPLANTHSGELKQALQKAIERLT